jgi:hydrogenase expression/formation protein HypC
MCLAVPYTLSAILDGHCARATAGGVSVMVRLDLIDDPQPGDTLLVHAGFAIQKLEPAEAEELRAMWEEARAALEAQGTPQPHEKRETSGDRFD